MNPKETFVYFWKTDDSKIVFIRDIVMALLAVLLVLLLLWTYTGQWFAAPMVAIESGSMEHPENPPFGRLGTIDAGDMVLVQKVNSYNNIVTHVNFNSDGTFKNIICFNVIFGACGMDTRIASITITTIIGDFAFVAYINCISGVTAKLIARDSTAVISLNPYITITINYIVCN